MIPLTKYKKNAQIRVCVERVQKWTPSQLNAKKMKCDALKAELKAHSVIIPSKKDDMIQALIEHYKDGECAKHNAETERPSDAVSNSSPPLLIPPLPALERVHKERVDLCTTCGATSDYVCCALDCERLLCTLCGLFCVDHVGQP